MHLKSHLAFLLSVLAAGTTFAQGIAASSYWEFSLDGTNWTRDALTVAQSTSSVRVRMMGAWTGTTSPTARLTTAGFDAVVTSPTTLSTDSVSAVALQANTLDLAEPSVTPGAGLRYVPSFGGQRFGNLLKVDWLTDLALPGQGSLTMVATNSPGAVYPSSSSLRLDNPIALLDFVLALDGTLGVRETTAIIHRPGFPAGTDAFQITDGSIMWVPVTQTPGSLMVIPAPGVVAMATAGLVVWSRRRSR